MQLHAQRQRLKSLFVVGVTKKKRFTLNSKLGHWGIAAPLLISKEIIINLFPLAPMSY